MTQVLLFDWAAGAHNELYLERFSSALPRDMTPVVAAPSATAEHMARGGIESYDLGDPRPLVNTARHLRSDVSRTGRQEFELFRGAIMAVGPEFAIHMFADGMLRHLVSGPPLQTRVGVLLFRPRAHYAGAYGTYLSPRQKVLGAAYEMLLRRWRRRRDAHAVMTLDQAAADRWSRQTGARAVWIPEPPIYVANHMSRPRVGATLFGSLAPRKGIERLVAAASVSGKELTITLAGTVAADFELTLRGLVKELQRYGVDLDLRPFWHDENATIELLGSARCAVLPYANHYGMSRVLLEAAYAGTPVITHRHGLLGHLVARYGIGLTVDTDSATDFRQAIDVLCHDDEIWGQCHDATEPFVDRYKPDAFKRALATALER